MLIRLTVFGAPGGPLKYPPVLCGKYFEAKMMNIADLEYSAVANSGMRQVKHFFPAHFSPSDDNRRGCSSDQPPWGPQAGPKYPQGLTQKRILSLKGDLDYSADANSVIRQV